MSDASFILKQAPKEDSQHYSLLRELGISYVQQLTHKVWTDHNVHDPGITLLELLSYAITDLGYRTAYDMKDLLTEEINGVRENNSTFHTARHIFPNNPTTFNDLRKWLVDIDGLRNAWIRKHESIRYCLDRVNARIKDDCLPDAPGEAWLDPLNGLFDVLLDFEDYVEADDRIARLGIRMEDESALDASQFIAPNAQGMEVKVRYPFELRRVHIYHDATDVGTEDNLQIRLLEQQGDASFLPIQSVQATLRAESVGTKQPVELGFLLEAGKTYRLDAQGSSVQLYTRAVGAYPHHVLRVAELTGGYDGSDPDEAYYFFYDWELNYQVSPIALKQLEEAPEVVGSLGLAGDPSGISGYLEENKQKMVFDVYCPLKLVSVDVIPETAGTVTVRLLSATDELLREQEVLLTDPGTFTAVQLNWELTPGYHYRLDATGSTVALGRTSTASYPYELPPALEIRHAITHQGIESSSQYYFFYGWQVEYQPCLPQVSSLTRQDIRQAAFERIHQVRNLCEDLIDMRELKAEDVGVCADIGVSAEADLDEVLAELFYQLEQHISPSIHFYTIEELKEKGKTVEEIFEGPLLDHGFIDDDEFRAIQQRCYLRSSDILQIIMDVPGVETVKELSLLSFLEVTATHPVQPGEQVVTYEGVQYVFTQHPWLLKLQDTDFFAPDFKPERSRIVFYKNGLPYLPNVRKALERYQEKRNKHIRNRLKGHARDLPVPLGQPKAVSHYYPAQHDLPRTYRVGNQRVPASASDLRKAQSRQLKAFLLFFEQFLANYLAQLGNLRSLFSWEPGETRTYFTQPLEGIAQLEELYIDHAMLEPDLAAIIETQEVAAERKQRFLDHLLGRFSEDLTEYGLLMYSLYKEESQARVIRDKQCLLAHYPAASSLRGKAFNHRRPPSLTGFQQRLYGLLGIRDGACGNTWRNFASERLQVVNVSTGTDDPVYEIHLLNEAGDALLFQSNPEEACGSREQMCALLDNLIPFGAILDNWEWNASEARWELEEVCEGERRVFGFTDVGVVSEEDLQTRVIDHFAAFAEREGFHVVEHILLRKRSLEPPEGIEPLADYFFMPVEVHAENDPCSCVEVEDPYSFRMSIILPSWPTRFQSTRFRQFVEKSLRLEAPAHIYLKICWISHCEMRTFEACYFDWLDRHTNLPPEMNGAMPLPVQAELEPPTLQTQMASYNTALRALIQKLHDLTTVFPLARIHDCQDEGGEEPPITLNNTTLGSL